MLQSVGKMVDTFEIHVPLVAVTVKVLPNGILIMLLPDTVPTFDVTVPKSTLNATDMVVPLQTG